MVDLSAHIVAIGGSKPPKDSPLSQLLIDVRVWGSGSTWSREFLSPLAGLKSDRRSTTVDPKLLNSIRIDERFALN